MVPFSLDINIEKCYTYRDNNINTQYINALLYFMSGGEIMQCEKCNAPLDHGSLVQAHYELYNSL